MLILALDCARVTGWCLGNPDAKPESGSWELGPRGMDVRLLPGVLTDRLKSIVVASRPDFIAVEDFMQPAASKNQNATISQLLLHGGLHAFAAASRISVRYETAATIRKHVCGRSFDRGGDTKQMVLSTMKLLGLVPKDCTDTDRSDAVAVWAWAAASFGGARRQLVLA